MAVVTASVHPANHSGPGPTDNIDFDVSGPRRGPALQPGALIFRPDAERTADAQLLDSLLFGTDAEHAVNALVLGPGPERASRTLLFRAGAQRPVDALVFSPSPERPADAVVLRAIPQPRSVGSATLVRASSEFRFGLRQERPVGWSGAVS